MFKNFKIDSFTYIAVWFLVIGLYMSTSLLAGFHIFLLIPIFYFWNEQYACRWTKSQVFFWIFSIACLLSVAVNQDIESRGFSPMTKVKYYIIALLAIFPLEHMFNRYLDEAQKKKLFRAFLFFATLAGVSGLIGLYTGFNPLAFRKACHETRNCGMAGMYMNYAHGLNYFMTIMFALLIYKNRVQKFISNNWLYGIFAFNLFAFYATLTRGAWLGFLAAIPFAFIKIKKRLVIGGILAVVVIGTFSFFFIPKVQETFMNRQTSNDERIGSWRAAIKAFEERPLLGYGLLNFEPHSSELKIKYNLNNAYFKGHAHNIFLEFLATTGIIGFGSFVLWLIFWFCEMYQRNDIIALVAMPVIISFSVAGLTQSTFVLADNTFFMTAFYAFTQIKFKELES